MKCLSPSVRLRLSLLVTLALGTALSPGCGRKTRVESGSRDGVLHIAIRGEPPDLDPDTNIDWDTSHVLNALFEGLVRLSNDGHAVLPGAADRWEVSADGLIYTFHIRPDARWSNGAALTSDDFVFSFRRAFDPMLACEESSFGFAIAGAEAYAEGRAKDPSTLGLDAPDAHTFVIRLATPAPYFLSLLGTGTLFLPVNRASLERFGGVHQRGAAWTREGNLVCNGPFVLTRWAQNQVIEVRRNPLYWDAANVRLAGVNFYPAEDFSAQERGYRAGEFHVTTAFPIYKASAYETEKPSVLHMSPILRTEFLTFNVAITPFTDARVRQALSLAVDRDRLASAVYHSFAEPAHALVRPGTGGYTPPASPSCRFDPDAARRLLAEAGYPGGHGFPVVELMLVGNDSHTISTGEVLQATWQSVLGIGTSLLPTEAKVYFDAERTKHYHVILDIWISPWDDPSSTFQIAQSGNPNNDSGWSDSGFDRAYHNAEIALDPKARARAFDVQEARLAAGVPYAPIFFTNQPQLVHPAVRG